MTKETKHLVFEMSLGMLGYVLVWGILALIFEDGLRTLGFLRGPVLLGLFAGFLADVMMLLHMAYITERAAVSMDEGYANKTTVIHAVIRRIVFIIVLFGLGSLPQIDAVAMILGALGLKAGALLQPVVHRTFFPDPPKAVTASEESTTEERRTVYGNDENTDGSSGTGLHDTWSSEV